MGWYSATYVGPYAEVTVKLVEVRKDGCNLRTAFETCPDPTEGFCSKCGIEASKRFTTRKEAEHSHWDVVDLTDEHLIAANANMHSGSVYHFIPQVTRKGDPSFTRDGDECCTHDLSERNLAKEMDWFRFAFGSELAKVEAHYGNLEIKWGVIFHGG